MNQLIPIISTVIILPLIAFWLWMFWNMTNNTNLPSNSTAPLSWTPTSKFDWTLTFIFLNVFGAVLYYFAEYRNKR